MTLKLVALACLVAGGTSGLQGQSVTAVPKLDTARFSTTWYEIARYPWKKEKKCVRDGLQLYASGEKAGRLAEVTSCVNKKGYANVNNTTLHFQDKKVADGRLRTQFLFFFHRKQWVLALGDDYDWTLMGSPNHKQLWVLSTRPTLDEAVLSAAKLKASALGFDPAKLVTVLQTR